MSLAVRQQLLFRTLCVHAPEDGGCMGHGRKERREESKRKEHEEIGCNVLNMVLFFSKKLPMWRACSEEGFRRGKECFEIKLFSTFFSHLNNISYLVLLLRLQGCLLSILKWPFHLYSCNDSFSRGQNWFMAKISVKQILFFKMSWTIGPSRTLKIN